MDTITYIRWTDQYKSSSVQSPSQIKLFDLNNLTAESLNSVNAKDCAMREYVLHQAQYSGSLPGSGILLRLWDNWTARRAVASLNKLDDHLLRDIGVSRDAIAAASLTPVSSNAVQVLEELSHRRR
jgi:uncharacterized protein YjiS (DUF1127 family)